MEYDFDESILQPTGEEIVRVVYTQPKREGCLRDFCREHGIVCYLPLRKVCRLIRKGYKEKSYQYQAIVLRPMFPNYAFLRLNPRFSAPAPSSASSATPNSTSSVSSTRSVLSAASRP